MPHTLVLHHQSFTQVRGSHNYNSTYSTLSFILYGLVNAEKPKLVNIIIFLIVNANHINLIHIFV
jgi:hypothetical protein